MPVVAICVATSLEGEITVVIAPRFRRATSPLTHRLIPCTPTLEDLAMILLFENVNEQKDQRVLLDRRW